MKTKLLILMALANPCLASEYLDCQISTIQESVNLVLTIGAKTTVTEVTGLSGNKYIVKASANKFAPELGGEYKVDLQLYEKTKSEIAAGSSTFSNDGNMHSQIRIMDKTSGQPQVGLVNLECKK